LTGWAPLEHDPEVREEIEDATQSILIRALFKHEHAAPVNAEGGGKVQFGFPRR